MSTVSQAELDALVMMAQSGNNRAWELLFEYYQPGLLRFAHKLCSDPSQAKDAVQDVWLKSMSTLSRLQDPRTFRAWMYRAVKWRVLDTFRRQQTRQQATDKLASQWEDESPQFEPECDDLQQLIEQLPETEREAIYLFYQSDLSLMEISAVQAVPVGTVKSRLNRARNRLKNNLEKQDEYRSED